MDGDAVGAGQIVSQHPGPAAGLEHAHPAVHHLGRVQVAARVEGDVVWRDDVAALRTDVVQPTGLEIQCADLAAGHLRDIHASVWTGAQTVRAEQPAGRGEPLESPPVGGGLGFAAE